MSKYNMEIHIPYIFYLMYIQKLCSFSSQQSEQNYDET